MIYNGNGRINADFLNKITNTFYMCTGYPIGFQKNHLLTENDYFLSEEDNKIISELSSPSEPYEDYLTNHINKIFMTVLSEKKINYVNSTFLSFQELLLTYTLFHKNHFKGTLYLGPFRMNDITSTQLEQLSLLNPKVDIINIKHYLESIPFVNQTQLVSLQYLFKIVVQTETDTDDNFILYNTEDISVKPFTLDSSLSVKHHSYDKEEKIILELLQSDQELEELVKHNLGYVPFIPLAPNDVFRSEKNRLIIMSALCCRGAINLGVPSETAFSFADFFVNQLEKAESAGEIPLLITELLSFFRREIKKAKEDNQYSINTRTIINYVNSHIQQSLDLTTIARTLGLNYKYVSKLFREETGMNFTDYVHQKKVKIAKDLLKDQRYKIEDISYYLGFSEPYYFSRVFKRCIGITPSEYRKNNIKF